MTTFRNQVNRIGYQFNRSRNLQFSWVLIILVGLIIFSVYKISNFNIPSSHDFQTVLNSPFSYEEHLKLAQSYLSTGNLNQAESELNLAKEYSIDKKSSVLGVISKLDQLEKELQIAVQAPGQEEAFWQMLQIKYPSYKVSLFNLIILAYNKNDISQTRSYLMMLLDRYPDMVFELPEELLKLLNK
jgi:hypothetical protein